jgi:hypothetical protein
VLRKLLKQTVFFVDLRITLLLSVFQMPVHVNVLSYEARLNRVISSVQFIVDYDYDTEQELWCKIKLAVSMFFHIIIVLSQILPLHIYPWINTTQKCSEISLLFACPDGEVCCKKLYLTHCQFNTIKSRGSLLNYL